MMLFISLFALCVYGLNNATTTYFSANTSIARADVMKLTVLLPQTVRCQVDRLSVFLTILHIAVGRYF